MKIVSGEEMSKVDKVTIEEVGIPGPVLMEEAGKGTALHITKKITRDDRILVITGKGNNGGDGYVIHRWLRHWGYDCTTILLAGHDEIGGDARLNLDILYKLNERIIEIDNRNRLDEIKEHIKDSDLIVDAILGTGLKGDVRGISSDVIELINQGEGMVCAVDIPSGLDSVKGVPLGLAVEADFTVTFALPKIGLLLYPGQDYVGNLEVIDIGIPRQVIDGADFKHNWVTRDNCREMLPLRPKTGHKGTFGRVLVIAGSEGMSGAAALTSTAALRSGAGLVTLAVPESLNPILEVKLTEVMTRPLPEKDGQLSTEGIIPIHQLLEGQDIVVVGPGLGESSGLESIMETIINETEAPLVIDADGLNNIRNLLSLLKKRDELTVLTPHPGELARLLDIEISELLEDRLNYTREMAEEYGVVLVSKGAPTITAFPNGHVYINSTGNEGMGTGGTGDVLTGVIGGMLAQQTDLFSVVAAVYTHGLAGDLKAEKDHSRSLLAGDLLDGLALAFNRIET